MPISRTLLVIADSDEGDEGYRRQLQQDSSCDYHIWPGRYPDPPLALFETQRFDGILLGAEQPHSNSIALLCQLKTQMGDRCPPIVVIDGDDAVLAAKAFRSGAADYLVRDRMAPEDLRLAMRSAIDNAELRQELARSQAQFRTSIETMLDCFGIFTAIRNSAGQIVDFRIDYLNGAACENNRMSKAMQIGQGLCELLPAHRESGLFDEYCRLVETGEPLIKDSLIYDDTYNEHYLVRAFDIRAAKLNDGFVAAWRDVTDRRWLELELSHTVADLRRHEASVQALNRDLTNRVAELQSLLELLPVGIAIATDAGCTQMEHNAYLRQLLGVDPGKNISQSAPPPEKPAYRVLQNGQEVAADDLPMQMAGRLGIDVRDVEFEIVQPDGTRHQLLCYATPLRDSQSGIRGVVGAFLDITERNRDATALQASQQRYRELAEAMPQMIWTADATGTIDYRNQRWYDYTGLSAAESIGVARAYAVHPEDRDRALADWRDAIATGNPFETECRVRRWDGVYQWFICRAIPTRDEDGNLTSWIGTLTNIDEIKRSEALVQRQLAEIEAIYESAPIGLNVLDADLRFVRINQHLADINGLPIEAHLGHRVQDLFPALAEPVETLLRPILQTGEPLLNVKIQGETPAQPGVQRTWMEHFLPLKAGGQVVGISTVCEEITERIQVEAALRQSEARFREMADNAPAMIWVTDSTGHCNYLNRGWYQFTGQTEATALGFGWLGAVHPDDSAASEAAFLRANERREGFRLEYRLRHQSGDYHWVIDAANPWFDGAGDFKGFIGSVIDISERARLDAERKRAEEALHSSEDRLRLTLESAELGTWDFNPLTQELTWDDQCKAMFGLPPSADITWEVFLAGLHPDDRDRTEQVVVQSLDPTGSGDYDIEYRTVGLEDGIVRWIAAKGKAFFSPAGEATRFIGTVLNITDKKRAETEREQLLRREQTARAEAERANRIKDEFLAVLSHELRSPLNPILGWAKLLQTHQLDATKTAVALATIERNAILQTQLIDDLLDIAKILRGKLSLSVAPVNLVFVIEAAVETVATAAAAKMIGLHSDLPNIGQVSGDAARLQQIVWNLLSNAVKFTPQGGKIDILLERVDDQAKITVKDTGKGIHPDFMPHIFETFRQEDASITRQHGGLGLGLAIVRQLVESHGGTIAVESPGEGMGTCFTVQLPLLTVAPDCPRPQVRPQFALDLTGLRVLAVDDDPDARELLSTLLSHYGAEVLLVDSAAQVLAKLASFQPDLLISDIGMPEVDGCSLIQQVRALPAEQGGQIPAIALTAYAREEDYQQAISSGFQDHITKPLEPERLVQALIVLVDRNTSWPVSTTR
ncbi:PAS domain S-box protein [Leptolyngbya sp. KIOST-1]|uniref:PAS domain S-box protein n=1 Tax=Leptolyngbya sp. KIOST-1 TaxID=1229172 RepID=UPI00068ECC0E|nr:PAS domain S-box protein [Leptolyngbya sp. KIOST-1]